MVLTTSACQSGLELSLVEVSVSLGISGSQMWGA